MVSKARLDLPDPESPVNTIRRSRGSSTVMFLRLCSRAPRTEIVGCWVRGAIRPLTLAANTRSVLRDGPDPADPEGQFEWGGVVREPAHVGADRRRWDASEQLPGVAH